MIDPEANLKAAEAVARILGRHQVPILVIGAIALAAYHYVRQTEDIDLGVNADLATLRILAAALQDEGFQVELLTRNPSVDRTVIREVCERYRLRGLEDLLKELT